MPSESAILEQEMFILQYVHVFCKLFLWYVLCWVLNYKETTSLHFNNWCKKPLKTVNNIHWRDVQRHIVVNNVDMSSLRAPWHYGPYKNQHTKQHKNT